MTEYSRKNTLRSMSNAIHITTARKMLDKGQPVTLRYVKRNGSVIVMEQTVSLRYDFYKGTRTVKLLRSGEKRTIRDVCIIGINDMEVFL